MYDISLMSISQQYKDNFYGQHILKIAATSPEVILAGAIHPNETLQDSNGDVAETASERGGHTGSERIISAIATQWHGHVDPQEV